MNSHQPREGEALVSDETDAVHAEIRTVLDERVEAMRAKNIERAMALYAPDIVYFDVVPPIQFVGSAAVRGNFLRWFAEYQGEIGLETHELRIAVNRGVAFAHMLHLDSGTRRGGAEMEVWIRSTVCLLRLGEHWLITHEHISLPPKAEDWGAIVDAVPAT